MKIQPTQHPRRVRLMAGVTAGVAALALTLVAGPSTSAAGAAAPAAAAAAPTAQTPHWISDAAHDTSPRISTLAHANVPTTRAEGEQEERAEEIEDVPGNGFAGDPAAQTALPPATIGAPRANFEGLSNQDNFNFYGGRVNPPDTIGDVGRSQYVEMTNLMIGIFSKATGQRLTDPDPDRCGLGRLPDRRLH